MEMVEWVLVAAAKVGYYIASLTAQHDSNGLEIILARP